MKIKKEQIEKVLHGIEKAGEYAALVLTIIDNGTQIYIAYKQRQDDN